MSLSGRAVIYSCIQIIHTWIEINYTEFRLLCSLFPLLIVTVSWHGYWYNMHSGSRQTGPGIWTFIRGNQGITSLSIHSTPILLYRYTVYTIFKEILKASISGLYLYVCLLRDKAINLETYFQFWWNLCILGQRIIAKFDDTFFGAIRRGVW